MSDTQPVDVDPPDVTAQAAFGADPSGDPSAWEWTDLTLATPQDGSDKR